MFLIVPIQKPTVYRVQRVALRRNARVAQGHTIAAQERGTNSVYILRGKKRRQRLPEDDQGDGGQRGRGGSCRLTNYTRSTRFTGDALSETIVHPRSLLYLFTPPLGRLCPFVNRPSSLGSSASPFVPRGPHEKDGGTRRRASRREREGDRAVFVAKKPRNADRRKGIRFQSDNRSPGSSRALGGLARRA